MSKSIEINFLTDFFEISKVNIIMSCRVHGKQNQVPNFKLFEAYFRQLLGALPVCNAFFQFSRGIFASQKFYDFTCCLGWVGGGTFLNCHKFTKICPFLFTLYACPGKYADISPRISQIYRYQPQGCFCFLSFISF